MTTQLHTFPATLLLATVIGPDEIGKRIKRTREQRGWTQLQFAREANVSPSSVARWEGGTLPPVRELIRLAGVLGIDPDELVETEPTEQDQLAALREDIAELHRMVEDLLGRSS